MRMTVATCVMLLELTNNLALLPLMMLVTLVAKVGWSAGAECSCLTSSVPRLQLHS
jgi:H+/Cl- antiporter ClcA